jgi:mannose/fructose/N-acetylgalactosamine-specific phosphotransferase system component IIC
MAQSALTVVFVYWLLSAMDFTFTSWQVFTRPIVVAPITGLFLGDFHTGIVMGAALESIFMGISAIGGSVPADALSSSIIAVAFTVLTGASVEAGLAIALPIGTLMASFNSIFFSLYAGLAPYWENLAAKGNMKNFGFQVILFDLFFARIGSMIALFMAVAYGVAGLNSFLATLPVWVMVGLGKASGMMTAVGFAIITSMIWNKEVGAFFFVGFVLAKYLSMPTLAIAILAGVVAVMYFFNEKKFVDLHNAGATRKPESEDFF